MDKILHTRIMLFLLACGFGIWVSNAQAFAIEAIEIQGLERIGKETALTYLPLEIGEEITRENKKSALKELYKTGFFSNIEFYLAKENTLLIKVTERPSIALVKIEGNKLIKSEDFNTALEGLGIKQGKIYNSTEMERVVIDLQRQYHNQGYYAAGIKIEAKDLPRNRVELKIKVEEGRPAKIERISLVGNHTYSDERLADQFILRDTVIVGSRDKYAKPKLQSDLETLRSYYMDRGFAEYRIDSSEVSLSADKTKVFISVSMNEGPQYKIGSVAFTGRSHLTDEQLRELAKIETGMLFSRSKIVEAINKIRDKLSEEGYAFAEVEPDSEIHREQKLVDLTFHIEPRNRVYVRKIEIEGNTRTRDHVVRREMRQLESAPYSLALVRQSINRLNRLGYFSKVDVDTRRFSADEVDLVIEVEEQPTGSLSAGIGYSQLDGVSFNFGVSEKNYLGTGNELDLSLTSSVSTKTADIGVTNPYFTEDGVSLGVGVYYYKFDASKEDYYMPDYNIDKYGARLNLGYPTSENTGLRFGVKAENIEVRFYDDDLQNEICADQPAVCGIKEENLDKDNNYLLVSAGWYYDTRNGVYFPSKGQRTSINLETVVPATSDLTYYKLYLDERAFFPLSKNFTLKLSGSLSYGKGFGDLNRLPFYERFYAGGIGSVRGFEPNSLGGYYQNSRYRRAKGGDVKTLANAELVFPMPLIGDSSNLRLSLFYDAGYIFDEWSDVDTNEFRSSYGLGFSWITPVGPLAFSLARALKHEKSDQLQTFQFSLGTAF